MGPKKSPDLSSEFPSLIFLLDPRWLKNVSGLLLERHFFKIFLPRRRLTKAAKLFFVCEGERESPAVANAIKRHWVAGNTRH